MKTILSLCDGFSCGQIALRELGIKYEKYYASEIDKFAIAQTQLNFPDTVQLGDIEGWREWDIAWGEIDLILAGTPCFTKGTNVLTVDGYKDISDMNIGDVVFTHKNRWEKVTDFGSTIANTLTLKAQGVCETIVTENHPYYIAQRKRVWNNSIRKYEYKFSDRKFKPLSECVPGNDFICIPIIKNEINPLNLTDDECYLIGRYIADGHTRKDYKSSQGRPKDRVWALILSVGSHKIPDINIKHCLHKHTKSTHRMIFYNKRLVEIVENNCGCGAINKYISPTLLSLPKSKLSILLKGLMDGDGNYRHEQDYFRLSSVSKSLCQSITLLVAKLYGTLTSLEYYKRKDKCVIEGRTVNQNPTYTVSYRTEKRTQDKYYTTDDCIYSPIKRITKSEMSTVYNITVEKDNSYTANNAIVHNCTGFSFAGKGLAFDDPQSRLFFVFVEILNHVKSVNPDVKFLLENVKMTKKNLTVINEMLGIMPVLINSSLVSAQNRERYYWSNIRTRCDGLFCEIHTDIPQPKDRKIYLLNILEENVHEKYYLKEKTLKRILKERPLVNPQKAYCVSKKNNTTGAHYAGTMPLIDTSGQLKRNHSDMDLVIQLNPDKTSAGQQPYQQDRIYDISGKCPALLSEMSSGTHAIKIPQGQRVYDTSGKSVTLSSSDGGWGAGTGLYEDSTHVRRLTPAECARLQTVPEWYVWQCSDMQQYRMLGNGWTIEVITHILSFFGLNGDK
ncbi:MAG: DNA cytosine methyltransferase [Clostridiales bacterium]|jgi:DNA (cytosine-5)-methyltransferase 3A|nr:DNA cytosine methyltransferase [Clostridiales bacterium]